MKGLSSNALTGMAAGMDPRDLADAINGLLTKVRVESSTKKSRKIKDIISPRKITHLDSACCWCRAAATPA